MTVSEKLRLVYGLHHHAEMFGFNWYDDSDWTWHDVACKIADEVDAENAKLRELVRDYEHCSMHADCDLCEYDGKLSTHCPLSPCFPDIDELNELGVDVP